MKKLMIGLCGLMLASSGFAATMGWSAWGYAGDPLEDEAWYTGGQAYLLLVTDVLNFDVEASGLGWTITGATIVNSKSLLDGSANGVWNSAENVLTLNGPENYFFSVLFTTDGVATTNPENLPTTGTWGYTATPTNPDSWNPASGGVWNMDDTLNGGNGVAVNTPVPEPATGMLALAGAALLLRRRRRRA